MPFLKETFVNVKRDIQEFSLFTEFLEFLVGAVGAFLQNIHIYMKYANHNNS